MAKTVLMIVVEYDDKRTDPESIASAVDQVIECGLLSLRDELTADYGETLIGKTYPSTQNPDHIHKPDIWFEQEDETDFQPSVGPPIRIGMAERVSGAEIDLNIAANNQALGTVRVDYFADKLQVCIYTPDDDEPRDVIVLYSRVTSELAKSKPAEAS